MRVEELNATLRELAGRYAEIAKEVLGENLLSLALFGSVARGEAGPHSDIDLFVVCRKLPKGMMRRRRLLEPVRERLQKDLEGLWRQGIYADFTELILTEEEARRFRWLYLEMMEEAVILFDREGFLRGVFEALRRRLRELGARRRKIGKLKYWDLKPDMKPGEVVEL